MIFCLLVFTLRCTPSYLFAYTSNNYIYPLRSLLGILSFANISYSTLYSYLSHREFSAYNKVMYIYEWIYSKAFTEIMEKFFEREKEYTVFISQSSVFMITYKPEI